MVLGRRGINSPRSASQFSSKMGLSAAASQYATPTNSMGSVSIRYHSIEAKTNRVEAANSIHTPSLTSPSVTPAISHRHLGSPYNPGKTPLDHLLANPIQFVKTSMMSPIYKRTQAEAFGTLNSMSGGKKRPTKKPPKTLSPMTLVTHSNRFGAEHTKLSNVPRPLQYSDSSLAKERLHAKQRAAIVQKPVPELASKLTTKDKRIPVDGATSPSLTHRKAAVLVTKEEPKDKSSNNNTTVPRADSPSSHSRGIRDKANRSSPQPTEKPVSKNKAIGSEVTVSPPLYEKKVNGVTALDKPIESPSGEFAKVFTNGDSTSLAKEVPKKRKADNSDGINPPAQKIRTDLNGNSSINQSEPDGSSPSKQISLNKSGILQPGIRAKGFSNRMNDCYRNSVLQLFCSCALFRREIVHHHPGRCKLSTCVCCTLRQLFENHHYDTKSNARKSTNKAIPEITRMARILPKNFKGTRQEDATEYFHAVLHTAKDQLNKGLKGDALKDNPIDKTFGGSFPSVLTCPKCHHRSYNKADLPSLMLHPYVKPRDNKATNIINLAELLNDHFRPEKVDATCEKCKHNKRKFTKQIEIEKLPEFLVLNIMRWTNTTMRGGRLGADKIMNRLKYEEKIKLMEGEKPVEYALNAVVAHSGRSLSDGHYISFVKQPDGTWAECNDQMVNQTTWSTVSRAGGLQATILGYQRVD